MNALARSLLTALLPASLLLFGLPNPASAQAPYPDRQIHMIIPLAVGSAVDSAARVLAKSMADDLGQSIYLENVPGSAGLIGAERVAKASADGYTLGAFNDSVLTMVPNIHKTKWDPLTDFVPVSLVGTIEWGLVVAANSPYRTVDDFIKAAKARPKALNYGSGGSGSPQHLAMVMFANQAGIEVTHVPYKGATPAAIAVASGEVEAAFQGLGTVVPLIASGRLRLLAVSTEKRLSQYPEVPTVAQAALPDFFFNSWFALVAPKGTSDQVVERLYASVSTALKDPDISKKLEAQGMTLRGTTPTEFSAALKDQYSRYQRIIQTNQIRGE
ncbi:Bug family tripartite tricarboxylate transporter substrate binding protein [Achromobacter deleyi]|uniref:Bug family tripartite tricarboxylate transporter substrate binding protein n=1 Tax=Achromobacter deleyi TaxID=1353891 RepID=UPI00149211D9|nr:tripartite tricarboxylate transporter substrate binding protein [Achromobacter deleyi]QVQ28292.1 tripartite tricarboxylate transporter substrate binding protein [Achromobacter deleyi]